MTLGSPKPWARVATSGTESVDWIAVDKAHWLFSQMKTTGSLETAAMLSASSTTPWLAAPSPKKLIPTRSSPFRRAASAAPVVIGALAPTTASAPSIPRARQATCMEPPLPLQ